MFEQSALKPIWVANIYSYNNFIWRVFIQDVFNCFRFRHRRNSHGTRPDKATHFWRKETRFRSTKILNYSLLQLTTRTPSEQTYLRSCQSYVRTTKVKTRIIHVMTVLPGLIHYQIRGVMYKQNSFIKASGWKVTSSGVRFFLQKPPIPS